jgi:hypothetical protein
MRHFPPAILWRRQNKIQPWDSFRVNFFCYNCDVLR